MRCLLLHVCAACVAGLSLEADTSREHGDDFCDVGTANQAASCGASSLLQIIRIVEGSRRLVVSASSASPSRSESRHGEETCHTKLAWFHAPKCGTSFGNTLFHYANQSLPKDAALEQQQELGQYADLKSQFLKKYPLDEWFQGCFWLREYDDASKASSLGMHQGIDDKAWASFEGEFVGMFRSPSSRLVSSWEYFSQLCTSYSSASACASAPVEEYALRNAGLVAKMLAGDIIDATLCTLVGWEMTDNQSDASKPCEEDANVTLALRRLDGFKFIGLTEEWELSICLFHKMFGGDCLDVEFQNSRPTESITNATVDDVQEDASSAFLRRIDDAADNAVYEKASSIFWANVKAFDATPESCASICPWMSR